MNTLIQTSDPLPRATRTITNMLPSGIQGENPCDRAENRSEDQVLLLFRSNGPQPGPHRPPTPLPDPMPFPFCADQGALPPPLNEEDESVGVESSSPGSVDLPPASSRNEDRWYDRSDASKPPTRLVASPDTHSTGSEEDEQETRAGSNTPPTTTSASSNTRVAERGNDAQTRESTGPTGHDAVDWDLAYWSIVEHSLWLYWYVATQRLNRALDQLRHEGIQRRRASNWRRRRR